MKNLLFVLVIAIFLFIGCPDNEIGPTDEPSDSDAITDSDKIDEIVVPDKTDLTPEPDKTDLTPEPDKTDETPEPDKTEVTPEPDKMDETVVPDKTNETTEPDKSDETTKPDEKNETKKDEVKKEKTEPFNVEDYMNRESVKTVVDKFMSAIQTENDIEFQNLIDWETVAKNAQKTTEQIKKYFNMNDLKKALGYFNVEINFPEKLSYYNKRCGLNQNVGYGMWKCTPKGEIGQEFSWIIRLSFNIEAKQWKVVEMGELPKEVMGFTSQNFAIVDEERGGYVLYIYYFTPEQWVALKKNEEIDPDYAPASASEYHHRNEVAFKKFTD